MRRATRLLVALPLALAAIAVAIAFHAAQRTLGQSARSAATQHQLAFSLRPLEFAPAPSTFEPVDPAAAFTSGTFLAGKLYLAGPGGLSVFAADGTLLRMLRTGIELPVEPIVALAQGRLRGATEPQLLMATAGAGLLLLESRQEGGLALRQLLPASRELADLTVLLALPSGDLLLGTRHRGVLLYNGTTLSPLSFQSDGVDPSALSITALAAADSSSYLIGTRHTGLFFLHAGTARHADAGLPDQQVDSIVVAGARAYAGTPLGVAEFDLAASDATDGPLRPARILASGTFSHALAFAVPSSSIGPQLVVGSLDQGIVPVSLSGSSGARPRLTRASITAPAGLNLSDSVAQHIDQFLSPSGPGAPLYALADGRLLVHTSAGWSAALSSANSAPALTDGNISALAFDSDGRLFIGFFDRGLDVLEDPGRASATDSIRHFEDDHLFCINRLMLDPNRNTIAAATANGLVLFDRQGSPRQVLTRHDGLISDHITDIAFLRIGTTLATPAGLTFITPSGTESLYAFQGLVNNHVYTLASRPTSDTLLAGTLGGLSVLGSGPLGSSTVKRNFTATNSGLKHNWITALASLPDGSDLIGTYGAGIERATTQKDGSRIFTPIELPAGAPRDLVINPNAILVTATHVYAGTLAHGMLVYTLNSDRWSIVTQGLPSLNVNAFAARNGTLYIGTENGLVRISEQAIGSTVP